MSSPIRRLDDLKSALLLSGMFGIAAAFTVPALLPALPPDAQKLPLPVPAFCIILAIQLIAVYGLLGFCGLRLARFRGLNPAPQLTSLWTMQPRHDGSRPLAIAFAAGLSCGLLLVGVVAAIQYFLPGTLPATLHPPGIVAALVASTAGSLGEEILFRLFLLSLLLRYLPEGRAGTSIAVGLSALAFGAAHAPAFIFLFGGLQEFPPVAWI